MRIVLITRHIPQPSGTSIERLLFRRLEELSALNYEVMVLTRLDLKTAEPNSVDPLTESEWRYPKNVDVRKPFQSFLAHEWSRALPLLIGFGADVLHVVDDFDERFGRRFFGKHPLRLISIEAASSLLRRFTKQKRAILSTSEDRSASWDAHSFDAVDTQWLQAHRWRHDFEVTKTEPADPARVLLAGGPKERPDWLRDLRKILEASSRLGEPIEVFFECDRQKLSASDRHELGRLERTPEFGASENQHAGLGARLFLIESVARVEFDAVIAAGLAESAAADLPLSWNAPVVQTDTQNLKHDWLVTVPDAAWWAWAVRDVLSQNALMALWSQRAVAQTRHTDTATNLISRLY